MQRLTIAVMMLATMAWIAGCGEESTPPLFIHDQARATAIVANCWPEHIMPRASPTPTPVPTVALVPVAPEPYDMPSPTPTPSPMLMSPRPTATSDPLMSLPPCPSPSPITQPTPAVIHPERGAAPFPTTRKLEDWTEGTVGRMSGWIRRVGMDIAVFSTAPRQAVAAWIDGNWRVDGQDDGDVWAMILTDGSATTPRRLNDEPVSSYRVGRVAVAGWPDGRAEVWYGDGKLDRGTVYRSVWQSAAWSRPQPITDGSIQGLAVDELGTLHAVRIGPQSVNDTVWYGTRHQDMMQWERVVDRAYHATIAVTVMRGTPLIGILTVPSQAGGAVTLAVRRGTSPWRYHTISSFVGKGEEPPSLTIAPIGDGIILGTWGGYGGHDIAVLFSDDGGTTVRVDAVASYPTSVFAIDPMVAIDPFHRRLIVAWTEQQDSPIYPDPVRFRRAWAPFPDRGMAPTWIDRITATNHETLDGVLDSARLQWGTAPPRAGFAAILAVDPRNQQWIVSWMFRSVESLWSVSPT